MIRHLLLEIRDLAQSRWIEIYKTGQSGVLVRYIERRPRKIEWQYAFIVRTSLKYYKLLTLDGVKSYTSVDKIIQDIGDVILCKH